MIEPTDPPVETIVFRAQTASADSDKPLLSALAVLGEFFHALPMATVVELAYAMGHARGFNDGVCKRRDSEIIKAVGTNLEARCALQLLADKLELS